MNLENLSIVQFRDKYGFDYACAICEDHNKPTQDDIDRILQIYAEEDIQDWKIGEILEELRYNGFDIYVTDSYVLEV